MAELMRLLRRAIDSIAFCKFSISGCSGGVSLTRACNRISNRVGLDKKKNRYEKKKKKDDLCFLTSVQEALKDFVTLEAR